jgi:hypothetical protein
MINRYYIDRLLIWTLLLLAWNNSCYGVTKLFVLDNTQGSNSAEMRYMLFSTTTSDSSDTLFSSLPITWLVLRRPYSSSAWLEKESLAPLHRAGATLIYSGSLSAGETACIYTLDHHFATSFALVVELDSCDTPVPVIMQMSDKPSDVLGTGFSKDSWTLISSHCNRKHSYLSLTRRRLSRFDPKDGRYHFHVDEEKTTCFGMHVPKRSYIDYTLRERVEKREESSAAAAL